MTKKERKHQHRWNLLRQAILHKAGKNKKDFISGNSDTSSGVNNTTTAPSSFFQRNILPWLPLAEHATAFAAARTGDSDSPSSAYELVEYNLLDKDHDNKLIVRLRQRNQSRPIPFKELLSHRNHGVDNTGNVRIWPAEEALLAYCLRHPHHEGPPSSFFQGKRILELGAGMTGLLGFGLSLATRRKHHCHNSRQQEQQPNLKAQPPPTSTVIVISDGNPDCLDNLKICASLDSLDNQQQKEEQENPALYIEQFRWRSKKKETTSKQTASPFSPAVSDAADDGGKEEEIDGMLRRLQDVGPFDLILAADILFFEESHDGLIDALEALLAPPTTEDTSSSGGRKRGGEAWLVQPERVGSMQRFLSKIRSCQKGLAVDRGRSTPTDDAAADHEGGGTRGLAGGQRGVLVIEEERPLPLYYHHHRQQQQQQHQEEEVDKKKRNEEEEINGLKLIKLRWG